VEVTIHFFQYPNSERFYSYKTKLEFTSIAELHKKANASSKLDKVLQKFEYIIENELCDHIADGTIWYNQMD